MSITAIYYRNKSKVRKKQSGFGVLPASAEAKTPRTS
jgi:hypothetical protein